MDKDSGLQTELRHFELQNQGLPDCTAAIDCLY